MPNFEAKNIIRNAPPELRAILNQTWDIPQNPKWHPEGNTFKHILIVLRRACDTENKNLIMAALFHDLGKKDVFAIHPTTMQPTAYLHDKASCKYVFKFRKYIKDFGANPLTVLWIVKNHMRVKYLYTLRTSKQNKLTNHPSFLDLIRFRYECDGGGHYSLLIR